jgi:hypothetical protein
MKIPKSVNKHPVRSVIVLVAVGLSLYAGVFTAVEAFRLHRLSTDLDVLSVSLRAVDGTVVKRSQGCGKHQGKYGGGIGKMCNDNVLITFDRENSRQTGETFKTLRTILEDTGKYEVDGLRELQDEPVVAGSFGFGGYKHVSSGRHCSTGYRQLESGSGEMRITCNAAPWYSVRFGINRPGF